MNTTLLVNYIDQLRQDRNLTQESFIDGIVSQRQYSRYKKGINDVPFDIIIKLTDRLSFPLSKVMSAFELSIANEINDVIDFFNYVVRNNVVEAHKLDAHLKNKTFINKTLSSYYKIAQCLLNYKEETIDTNTLLEELKKELKYPQILDKPTLSDYEIYALGLIMQYEKEEIPIILEKLLTINRLNKFVDVKDPYMILLNQFFIIKNLGRLKRFEDVITYADQTIKFCTKHYINYMLENLHYYKALGHYYLKQQTLFETALRDTILETLRKPKEKQDRLFAMIEKDTKINPKTFIKDRLFS